MGWLMSKAKTAPPGAVRSDHDQVRINNIFPSNENTTKYEKPLTLRCFYAPTSLVNSQSSGDGVGAMADGRGETEVFIFLLPQHLCRSQKVCDTFFACGAKEGTLQTGILMVGNEQSPSSYPHVANGLAFPSECHQLKDIFFNTLFHP